MAMEDAPRVRATIVGSLPKPTWLAEPHRLFAPWRVAPEALAEAQEDAVRIWVAEQAAAGLDCVTDGEQRRRHYIWGFLEGLGGIDTETLGSKASRGKRYRETTAVARLVGGPVYDKPVFVEALKATRLLSDLPIKVTLPGPMTIVDSLLDTVGGRSEADLAMAFAEILNREALALTAAGAAVIQFDEPCFNIYVDQVKDWGIAALERAVRGVTATTAVHICYGYGLDQVKAWKAQNQDWTHYEHTLPLIAKSSIDQVSIETAASGVDIAVIETLKDKDVMLGVVDVGSETVETPQAVATRLRAALDYIEPNRLFACTDCGMAPLSRQAAAGKLRALADGAALVNQEL